jgi:hypothetical protein
MAEKKKRVTLTRVQVKKKGKDATVSAEEFVQLQDRIQEALDRIVNNQ